MATEVASALMLRAATVGDSPRLLSWRNDPAMRRAARNTARVERSRHAEWLPAVLADPNRHLLIGELGGRAVGQVRFDLISQATYEIAITVAPERRGAGIGTRLLAAALEWLGERGRPRVVQASVKDWNAVSLALFEAAAFVPAEGLEPGFVRLVFRY
jgi:RimJ/RimL family protein N-acetyltransferase